MAQTGTGSGPAPKRPRHDGSGDDASNDNLSLLLESLLFYPLQQQAGGGGGGGSAVVSVPSLKHTDPECHIR